MTLLAAPAAAGAPAGDVEAFVAEVMLRNPTLRARTLTRDAARHEARAAGSWPDPEVAVMLDRVPERMGGEMPMLRYQATQMLMWPGKLGLMQAAAEQRTGATQADAKTLKLDLIRDAKRAYWMLRLNQRQGVGSDVAKRIAAPMWGGLVSLTLLTLLLVPAVYVIWRSFELRRSPVAT